MRLRVKGGCGAGLLAALLLVAAVSAAPSPDPAARVVRLSLDVLETARGEPTRAAGGWSADLRAGEGTGAFYLTPSRAAGGEDVAGCSEVAVTAALAPPGSGSGRPVTWKAEARLLDAFPDGISLEVSWTRLGGRGASGSMEVLAEGTEVVMLRAGEHVLLDVVEGPAFSDDGCTRNLALDLSADLAPVAGLEARNISYDIWMTHQPPSGPAVSRVWQTTSIQGEEARFRFPRERLEALAGWRPGDSPAELILEISGSRPRLAPARRLDRPGALRLPRPRVGGREWCFRRDRSQGGAGTAGRGGPDGPARDAP